MFNLPPFSCTFSTSFADILNNLNCSLAITTYQAGKLIFLSANNEGRVQQLPRDFKRAMGLAIDKNRLAIATENEVIVLGNAPALAATYANKPNYYDHFYVPRTTYYTGAVDLHDMAWDKQGRLCAVNTLFSSLVYINDQYSFEPFWTPPFIDQFASEDYCHLNGMAMKDGAPKYVSMFGATNTAKGWRPQVQTGGLIMDVETNAIVASGLAMPHSPRWINGALYCLLSATGELIKIDTATGNYEVITKHNGFVRGLAVYGDYLFVGLSKNREKASVKRNLPVGTTTMQCGVDIVHLPTATIVASAYYQNSAEEIYDVQIIPDSKCPGVLNHTAVIHRNALHTPTACFWAAEKN